MSKVFWMEDIDLRIYFRIPFTMYFVGKCRWNGGEWSKCYLFTREFIQNGDKYYSWVRVGGVIPPNQS